MPVYDTAREQGGGRATHPSPIKLRVASCVGDRDRRPKPWSSSGWEGTAMQASSAEKNTEKLQYRTPQLTVYGSVGRLTGTTEKPKVFGPGDG